MVTSETEIKGNYEFAAILILFVCLILCSKHFYLLHIDNTIQQVILLLL